MMGRPELLAACLLVPCVLVGGARPAVAGNGDALLPLLPADTRMVVGVDVAGLAATDAFQRLYPLAEEADAFADQDLASLLGVAPDEALESIVIGISSLEPDGGPPVIVLEHVADPTALDERLTDLTTREADRFGAPCWSASGLWLCRPDATTIVVGPLEAVTRANALAWHAAERPETDGPLWPAHVRIERAAPPSDVAAGTEGDGDGADREDDAAAADSEEVAVDDGSLDDDDAVDRLDAWLDAGLSEPLTETIASIERGSGVWMAVVPGDPAPEPWIGHIEAITTTLRLSDALRLRVRVTFDDPAFATEQRDVVAAGLTSLAARPELRAVGLADALAAFEATVEGEVLAVRLDVPADDVDALVEQGAAILSSELE